MNKKTMMTQKRTKQQNNKTTKRQKKTAKQQKKTITIKKTYCHCIVMPFVLLTCMLHHYTLHGKTLDSCSNIDAHFLLTDTFTLDEFYSSSSPLTLFPIARLSHCPPHPIFSNYISVFNAFHKAIQIGQTFELPSLETIVVMKTHWIRLVQKTWKRVFKERKQQLYLQMAFKSIKQREIKHSTIVLPSIKGMLHKLQKAKKRT